MRKSAWRVGLAAGIALLLGGGPASAAVHNDPIPSLFGLGREDAFLLSAMRSDPQTDAQWHADFDRINAMPDGPDKEAQKTAFVAVWRERIAAFSNSYTPGQDRPGRKVSAQQACQLVPWVCDIDQRKWGGKLFQELHDRLSAPELALIVARMNSLNNAPSDPTRAGLVKSLEEANIPIIGTAAPVGIVADTMIGNASGDPKKTIRGYMAQLERESLARTPAAEALTAAKAQLQKIQAEPGSIAAVMDGAKTNPAAQEAPVVTQPGTTAVDTAHKQLQPPAQQAAPAKTPSTGADWIAGVPPPPPVPPDQQGPAQDRPDLRPTAKSIATSTPMLLGMAGGALVGAGLGLLLGGPIGALIGAGLGLILGAVGGFGFLTR